MTLSEDNERRVIHVEDEGSALDMLTEIESEFWAGRPGQPISSNTQHSATYLFKTTDDTNYFSELLDERDIAHSLHPAKDYDKVSIQDMNEHDAAIHRVFSKGL